MIKGLDAEPVAAEDERPLDLVPHGKGEHSPEQFRAGLPKMDEGLEQDFRVSGRGNSHSLFLELRPKLAEVQP